jgi:uncharacterized phiE125 gp8 family phage protein
MLTAWKLVTGPSELLDATTAKLQARIDGSTEDALVTAYITAARQLVELLTGYRIGSQTWEYSQGDWSNEFWLPGAPLIQVNSLKYYDADGSQQTLSTSIYRADIASEPGRIELVYGQVWPLLQVGRGLPITANYDAGFTSGTLPKPLYEAMLLLVAHFYANREAVNVSAGVVGVEVPLAVQALCGGYQAPWRPSCDA